MSNDYAKGFKDGFAAGLEEGKRLVPKVPSYPDSLAPSVPSSRCGVCGKDFGNGKIWGYVCNHARCPSRVTCGAVGATYDNMSSSYPVGMNGPTGSFNSPEYANKVWINGQWAELGN